LRQQQALEDQASDLQTAQQMAAGLGDKILELEQRLADEQVQFALRNQELEASREIITLYRRSYKRQRWLAIAGPGPLGLLLGIAFSSGLASVNWPR
jgi:hypothetical protein